MFGATLILLSTVCGLSSGFHARSSWSLQRGFGSFIPRGPKTQISSTTDGIISPFDKRKPGSSDSDDDDDDEEDEEGEGRLTAGAPVYSQKLELTLENVEKILDEMRPMLIADGGASEDHDSFHDSSPDIVHPQGATSR